MGKISADMGRYRGIAGDIAGYPEILARIPRYRGVWGDIVTAHQNP
jgi:hypothetical protein